MTDGDHAPDEGPDGDEETGPPSRQRGGSASAIANALHRTPHPGPQHWGGPRPRKADPDPFFTTRLGPPPKRRRG
ncbi:MULTISPECIES: calcium-binding protein [Nocardiopsis]|uniref:Calcium-binding protein n=1 Tax=Nocardiopsis tropica TaxID=109330 RepID=A0ABV2A5F3_9ACTN|nr:calcium-binding protein [Nocardiopsis tropica]